MIKSIGILFLVLISSTAFSQNRTVNLTIAYKKVNFSGHSRNAIAVNDQIPGPTLYFKQGDHVTINVYNKLDKGTSIHWHGLILPWQMDGVEGVTQKPIPPGSVFHYKFTIRQSGTYWYHAHSEVQEQEGIYGAFIIKPNHKANYMVNKDYPIILSDWSNTKAHNILLNLKKEGHYFAPSFPIQASLTKFIKEYSSAAPNHKKMILNAFLKMQKMRMGIYDFSDVAYDAYLLNGHNNKSPWIKLVRVGDTVRLRFIGASASTIYNVKIPGATMKVIQLDGNNIKPFDIKHFSIAPGETYDVIIKIKHKPPYVIYAESNDTLGKAIGALITKPNQKVSFEHVKPFEKPKSVPETRMKNIHTVNKKSKIKIYSMNMPLEPTITNDNIINPMPKLLSLRTQATKYQNLKSLVKTNNPSKKVDGILRIELFGYMDRFIWFINGKPEYKSKPIILEPGKRYRFIFTNNTMMKHPMHLHGHWFILRNGHGAYDPLLHTIVVPSGGLVVADVDSDASGQWFFHCHNLYHMAAGMSRVFQYSTLKPVLFGQMKSENSVSKGRYANRPIVRKDEVVPISQSLVMRPMVHGEIFSLKTHMHIGYDPFHNIQKFTWNGLYGWDNNKLQIYANDAEVEKGTVKEANVDLFYYRWISRYWAIKGGANYVYKPKSYWQPGIGFQGLLPYFIQPDVRIYFHKGSVKFDVTVSRDTQIARNFFIKTSIRSIIATKTISEDEIGNGLNEMRYVISPYYYFRNNMNVFVEYEHEQTYGALKRMHREEGEPTSANIISFGVDVLF